MLVAGCGGGDDSTTTITKVEFTKQADAICAEGEKERKTAVENYNKKIEAFGSFGADRRAEEKKLANELIDETVLPTLKKQLEQLEDLGAPAADEAQVSRMMTSLSKAIADMEKEGIQGLVAGKNLTKFQEEAKGYGLSCAF